MGMLVLKSFGNYLSEGSKEDRERNGFYCPHFSRDLLRARLFESESHMRKWLKEETNLQPRRLDYEHAGWALVPYAPEVADLVAKLVERMA